MIEFLNKLNMRWATLSGESRAIFHGISWVAIFLLAAKSIAAVKELLVAKHYGASALLDGYLFAFNVANWPIGVLASVSTSVLVPLLVQLETESKIDRNRFKKEILLAGLVFGLLMGFILWMLMPHIIISDLIGLSETAKISANQAVPFVAAMAPFGVVAAIYSAYLMSQQRHANTFIDGVPSLIIMLALLGWPWLDQDISLKPILWGTLLGFVVQAAWLAGLNNLRLNKEIAFVKSPSKYWKEISKSSLYVALAQLAIFTSIFADQIFLAKLPEGNIAGYGYAYRIILLILGLSSTALARAILPIITGVENYEKKRELAKIWALRVFWIGLLFALALAIFSDDIVALLFERGKFTKKDTDLVSSIFVVLLIQLPFALSFTVQTQWFLSETRATKSLLWAILTCALSKIICSALAVSSWGWGSIGVAFSYTIYNGIGLLILSVLFAQYGINRNEKN